MGGLIVTGVGREAYQPTPGVDARCRDDIGMLTVFYKAVQWILGSDASYHHEPSIDTLNSIGRDAPDHLKAVKPAPRLFTSRRYQKQSLYRSYFPHMEHMIRRELSITAFL